MQLSEVFAIIGQHHTLSTQLTWCELVYENFSFPSPYSLCTRDHFSFFVGVQPSPLGMKGTFRVYALSLVANTKCITSGNSGPPTSSSFHSYTYGHSRCSTSNTQFSTLLLPLNTSLSFSLSLSLSFFVADTHRSHTHTHTHTTHAHTTHTRTPLGKAYTCLRFATNTHIHTHARTHTYTYAHTHVYIYTCDSVTEITDLTLRLNNVCLKLNFW